MSNVELQWRDNLFSQSRVYLNPVVNNERWSTSARFCRSHPFVALDIKDAPSSWTLPPWSLPMQSL